MYLACSVLFDPPNYPTREPVYISYQEIEGETEWLRHLCLISHLTVETKLKINSYTLKY